MKDNVTILLEKILDMVGIDKFELEMTQKDDDNWEANIINLSDRDTALLIGRQGENLQALQYLLRVLIREELELLQGEEKSILVDIMNYRQRQIDHLTILAKRKAQEAKLTNREIELRPMTPFERRIIHMTLKDDINIETRSTGEEPYRKVVIRASNESIEI